MRKQSKEENQEGKERDLSLQVCFVVYKQMRAEDI